MTREPIERPKDWEKVVNRPQSEAEVEALRRCVQRGRPYGSETWQMRIAKRLGLECSLNPRGRPRRSEK